MPNPNTNPNPNPNPYPYPCPYPYPNPYPNPLPNPNPLTLTALLQLDTDGNGTLDKVEFVEWWVDRSVGGETALDKKLAKIAQVGRKMNEVDIHTSCWTGDDALVEEFLGVNAELANQVDNTDFGQGYFPLHYAAYQGHTHLCKMLVERKAKLNAVNADGCTALFLAAQQGHVATVEYLLSQGADHKLRDSVHQFSLFDVADDVVLDVFRCGTKKYNKPNPPPGGGVKISLRQKNTQLLVDWEKDGDSEKGVHTQFLALSSSFPSFF
jgi:hypothetical protein